MKKIVLIILIFIILWGFYTTIRINSIPGCDELFENYNATGTFVLKNISSQEIYCYNKIRSETQYSPASTFKVLNSLISLQNASVDSVNDTLFWNGVDYGYSQWNKNHSMESAFPVSCVWFYQELARRTGVEKMQDWIVKTSYGNQKIGGEIDQFWLDGSLKISAIEQMEFMNDFVNEDLPFSLSIQNNVKNIMISDATEDYILHSKTGWDGCIGWNIGYIETHDEVWAFAMNVDLAEMKNAKIRKMITYDVLRKFHLLN